MKLSKYLEIIGYTKEEWTECVDELTEKGVQKGCFQDYALLAAVLSWLLDEH